MIYVWKIPANRLLLCKRKDNALVHYALADLPNTVFVSKYQVEPTNCGPVADLLNAPATNQRLRERTGRASRALNAPLRPKKAKFVAMKSSPVAAVPHHGRSRSHLPKESGGTKIALQVTSSKSVGRDLRWVPLRLFVVPHNVT